MPSFARPRATLRVIHLATLASTGIYVVVAHAVEHETPADGVAPMLRYGLIGAAVLAALAVPILRRVLMPRGAPDHPYQRSPGAAAEPPATAEDLLARVLTAYLTIWAVSGSVATYGLILSFLAADAAEIYPFAVVSAALLVANAPRAATLDAIARAAEG